MSAEAFQTVMSCDMRTAADGRSAEYAPSGTGEPRWLNPDGTIRREEGVRGWASCYVYAEGAVRIAAQAVRDEVMTGETGDHPEKREQAARILEAAADLVRVLALDAAHDSYVDDERWAKAVATFADSTRVLPSPGTHDSLCPVYLAGGSCCPLPGGCDCQCMCDIYADVRADERWRFVTEGAAADGWMTIGQVRAAINESLTRTAPAALATPGAGHDHHCPLGKPCRSDDSGEHSELWVIAGCQMTRPVCECCMDECLCPLIAAVRAEAEGAGDD